MPVILDDAMLIPPSMRRKNYHLDRDRIIEIDGSSSTIEIPRQPPSHSHRPVVVHEEYAVERPPTEIITEREIIIDPGSRGVRRYRGPEYRRGRAQSLGGYDSFSETSSAYDDSEYYYLEDGTRHRHVRRGGVGEGLVSGLAAGGIARDRQRRYHDRPRQSGDPHKFRHMAEGAVIGGAVEHLRHRRRRSSSASSTSSDESDHRLRNLAGAGVAAAGAKVLYDRHRAHEREREGRTVIVEDPDRHRRIRRLAEAGAGLAAAGAAKGLYDHHRRNRSRSSSSSRSRSRSRSRVGRHLAATALGATAAGVAAHKLQRRRRGSWSSYSSSDDDSHRGRKVLAGAATAAAAGIAAKRLHDHRNRSRSSSASSDDSSHKLRNTALLGAAALAARHHHKKKERARSRSMSRPGILRRRSRTYSPPRRSALRRRSLSRHRSPRRHRSSSRGAALAKAAAVTMAGALAKKQTHRRRSHSRARSADAAAERRRRHMRGERRVHYHNDPRVYNGGSSASTVHPGESVSQAGGPGGRIRNAIMPAESHGRRSRRGSMAQDFAYKVGESVAEGLRRM